MQLGEQREVCVKHLAVSAAICPYMHIPLNIKYNHVCLKCFLFYVAADKILKIIKLNVSSAWLWELDVWVIP